MPDLERHAARLTFGWIDPLHSARVEWVERILNAQLASAYSGWAALHAGADITLFDTFARQHLLLPGRRFGASPDSQTACFRAAPPNREALCRSGASTSTSTTSTRLQPHNALGRNWRLRCLSPRPMA